MVDEYDVVVLGTGAAGLTAAVRAAADGARVGLFERADQVGGTSAWSGGVAWLPNNRHEVEADPDFHRGESHHDRAWGDHPAFGLTPQATVGPIDTPPYYAIRVSCGTLGTKGGPRTDGNSRVLNVDGAVIDGLYAAGNAMGSVMGMTYGGHGGTLGPALVFGYLAGEHAAARAAGVSRA